MKEDFTLNYFLCLLAVVGVRVDSEHFQSEKFLIAFRKIALDAVEGAREVPILDFRTQLEVVDVSSQSANGGN